MNTKSPEETLVKTKPIPLRLVQKELDEVEEIHARYGISRSDIARRAYRAGLSIVKKQLSANKE